MTTATIEEVISNNTIEWNEIERAREEAKDLSGMYGCERPEPTSVHKIAEKCDEQLAKKYKVIDLEGVFSIKHPKKCKGWVVPRFALFTLSSKDSWFSLRKSEESAELLNSGTFNVGDHYNWTIEPLKRGKIATENNRIQACRLFYAVAACLACLVFPSIVALVMWNPVALWSLFSIVPAIVYASWVGSSQDITFTATFQGVIPKADRKIVQEMTKEFNRNNVYLIQEVPQWNAKVTNLPVDPLVIGVQDGVAYLLHRFDTTTMEEYVAKEFTT